MFSTPRWMFVAIYLPPAALIAVVAVASIQKQLPVGVLTMDIAAFANVHPFAGILSNLGILLWCSSASTCLFSGVYAHQRHLRTQSRFLLSSGLFTILLLLDDLFLVHEDLAARYLGLNEKAIFVIYGFIATVYLITFWRTFFHTEYFLLCNAMVFFAISIAIDLLVEPVGPRDWSFLFEDGAKFMGITIWCGYYMRTSFQVVAASAENTRVLS